MRCSRIAALAAMVFGALAAPALAQGMGTGGGGEGGAGTGPRLKPVAGAPGTMRVAIEPTLDILWARGSGTAIADTAPPTVPQVNSRSYERMWEHGMGFGLSVYVPFEQLEASGAVKEQAFALLGSILSVRLPGRSSSFDGIEATPDDLTMLAYLIGGGLRTVAGGEDSPVRFLGTVTGALGGVQFNSVDLAPAGGGSVPLYDSTTGFGIDFRVRLGIDISISPKVSIGTTLQLGYLLAISPEEHTPIPGGWSDVSPDPIFLFYWGFALSATIRF